MADKLKIGVAQINTTVGDIKGNMNKILDFWKQAKDSDIVITPELSVTGYPLEDLVEDPDLLDAAEWSVNELAKLTKDGPALVVGSPHVEFEDGVRKIYNAAFVLENGEIKQIIKKSHLPNYGVFDEKRNFSNGLLENVKPVEFKGYKLGVMICEDTWLPDVSAKLKGDGAELLISMNASPFETGKLEKRFNEVALKRVEENDLDIIYLNQIGGQDELVFDGASFAISKSGKTLFQAPVMEEDLTIIECDKYPNGDLSIQPGKMADTGCENETLWKALVLGTKDYVAKTGFSDVVIGMSGGIDSAIVAAIAVDALGPDRVHLVRLPSQYTSDSSNDDADDAAIRMGVTDIRTLPIKDSYDALMKTLQPEFEGKEEDVTEENLQSRIRGTKLMALSNKHNWMLLTTGNKSEIAVGYCTLYGDTNGGFNPIKDVYKTKVYELSAWRNENSPYGLDIEQNDSSDVGQGRKAYVMPWNIIEKEPSAELREDQTDQDSLPPYEELDDMLERRIEQKQSMQEIINAGYSEEVVNRVLWLMKIAVYKQNQAAPGVKTTSRAVRGKDLRLPIANRFTNNFKKD